MNIKELRVQAGLTQQDLATKLGVSVRAVSMWETGKSKPSKMACKMLEQVFGKEMVK